MATNVPAPTLTPAGFAAPEEMAVLAGYGKVRHTVDEVKRRVGYDPETGNFWWKVKPSKNRFAGEVAGCIVESGYRIIVLDRQHYRAHQLAWAIVTGEWPMYQVDHRNMVRNDNRFENFRLATEAQNRANTGARKHNKSGYKGVQACGPRWASRITVNKKMRVLGYFDTPQEANEAYMRAAVEAFGEFARAA